MLLSHELTVIALCVSALLQELSRNNGSRKDGKLKTQCITAGELGRDRVRLGVERTGGDVQRVWIERVVRVVLITLVGAGELTAGGSVVGAGFWARTVNGASAPSRREALCERKNIIVGTGVGGGGSNVQS